MQIIICNIIYHEQYCRRLLPNSFWELMLLISTKLKKVDKSATSTFTPRMAFFFKKKYTSSRIFMYFDKISDNSEKRASEVGIEAVLSY